MKYAYLPCSILTYSRKVGNDKKILGTYLTQSCWQQSRQQGLVRLRLQGYMEVGFQLQKKQNLEFQIPKKATIAIWYAYFCCLLFIVNPNFSHFSVTFSMYHVKLGRTSPCQLLTCWVKYSRRRSWSILFVPTDLVPHTHTSNTSVISVSTFPFTSSVFARLQR